MLAGVCIRLPLVDSQHRALSAEAARLKEHYGQGILYASICRSDRIIKDNRDLGRTLRPARRDPVGRASTAHRCIDEGKSITIRCIRMCAVLHKDTGRSLYFHASRSATRSLRAASIREMKWAFDYLAHAQTWAQRTLVRSTDEPI